MENSHIQKYEKRMQRSHTLDHAKVLTPDTASKIIDLQANYLSLEKTGGEGRPPSLLASLGQAAQIHKLHMHMCVQFKCHRESVAANDWRRVAATRLDY